MTTTSIPVDMPVPSGYGAVELKKFIGKYTYRGFIITCSLLILFLLFYYLVLNISSESGAMVKMAPIVKIKMEDLPPPQDAQEAIPPPMQQMLNTGPAVRAGTPVPVPDAMITEDLKDFATMKDLSRASAEGGDGNDLGGFASNIDFNGEGVKVQVREKEPEPDEFIATEKEPVIDLAKIQNKIVYPEIARRAGIEGKVILRVMVQKDGRIKKDRIIVEYSDSQLLNEAAIQAIKDYGVATPAVQNGQPIAVWVSIPLVFKLKSN
ncbi:MAG: periplasmic protein TonB [Bacteroidota bacterium]|nr:periplasmic protein TonB [Bacteroidota bacterium]